MVKKNRMDGVWGCTFNSIEWILSPPQNYGEAVAQYPFNSIEWILYEHYSDVLEEISLSIPLNGFKYITMPASPYWINRFLSIPLNGFLSQRPSPRPTLAPVLFQFHWMDSLSICEKVEVFSICLSIPLNGFTKRVARELDIHYSFQFHWMDSWGQVKVVRAQVRRVPFNSIEWIHSFMCIYKY